MNIGRLEVEVWRDTGTPWFRVWFWKYKQGLYTVETYSWIFKILSWWTLWVAWRGPNHSETRRVEEI